MTITEEQAKKMTEELQQLHAMAEFQLSEHKTWLKNKLAEFGQMKTPFDNYARHVVNAHMNVLLMWHQVEEITLEVVHPEDVLDKNGRPTITVVYNYPDELYTFLTSEYATQELRDSLKGGRTQGLDKASSIERLPDTPGAKRI